MQRLLRLLVCLQIILLVSSVGHSADPPIRGKIPPEGTWVTYELSVSDGDNLNLGQGKAELTLKVLGREMRDAQQCRWLEVEFLTTVHEPDEQKFSAFFTKLTGVYKALVGENGLEAGDKEVTVFAIQTQVNHERPTLTDRPKVSAQLNSILQLVALLDEFLIVADQDPARLNKQLMHFTSIRSACPDGNLSPPVTIKSRQEKDVQTFAGVKDGHLVQIAWPLKYNVIDEVCVDFELAPAIPFGLSSLTVGHVSPRFFSPGRERGEASVRLKAIGYGNNAITAIRHDR